MPVEPGLACDRPGDQPGLVIAAPPQAPAMQGHRHQQRARSIDHQPAHLARQRGRDPGPHAVLEPHRQCPGNLAIGHRGAQRRDRRWIGHATRAACLGPEIEFEGQAAAVAGGRAEKIETPPAGQAEKMVGRSDVAAARTARRQREVDDLPKQGNRPETHARLSPEREDGTSPPMSAPTIFDAALRRLRRDRAAPRFAAHAFLLDAINDSLLDRLDLVSRSFARALVLGCHDGRLGPALAARGIEVVNADAGARFAAMAGGVQCDEDRLPFAPESFDLVISTAVLDQVNDLPGALIQVRRILKPDGLFLAGFVGAGSLPVLRAATLAADLATDGAATSRIHPQIDVRAAGDLLGRAGFALQVADSEQLKLRYSDPFRIFSDLRGMAATNMLLDRHGRAYGRARLSALLDALHERADVDGAILETVELVFMTGWAPGPGQPQPAKRGSATASLAAALKPKDG